MKCPMCEGKLIDKKVPYSFKGIFFGVFDAYVCNNCNESFMREKHLQSIEKFAKRMGLWGAEIIPHIDNSSFDKDNLFQIPIPQLFNKPDIQYVVTSVK